MRDARSSGVDASYAFFLGTCIGILDELFQAVLPNRVGDIRDVVINSIGVAWGVLLAKSLQKSSMQKDNLG
jgi:VanZ family protein